MVLIIHHAKKPRNSQKRIAGHNYFLLDFFDPEKTFMKNTKGGLSIFYLIDPRTVF